MICPNGACRQEHRGPRDPERMHHEAAFVIARAAEMATADATLYMRVSFLRLGLEMSGYCPSCVLQAQVTIGQAIAPETIEQVREQQETAEKLEELKGRAVHVCKVIPLFPKSDFYSSTQGGK